MTTTNDGRAPSGQALAVPVEPVSRLDPSGFDPSRLRARLKRIQAIAVAPGQHTGPAFDEIWSLAASCLATVGGDNGND